MQLHNLIANSQADANSDNLLERFAYRTQPAPLALNVPMNIFFNCTLSNSFLRESAAIYRSIRDNTPLPRVKSQCIRASLSREISGRNMWCDNENKGAEVLASNTKDGLCITNQVVSYIQYATNTALTCFTGPDRPLDPLFAYAKINNESGFNFSLFTGHGVGIGQLTTIAIEDMNNNDRIFQDVFSQNKPECEPFKKALESPANNALRSCPLNEPSAGLARSLAYSLGYFLRIREELNSGFKTEAKNLNVEDIRFENLASLVIYSRHGLKAREKLIELLNKNHTNYAQFKADVEKEFPYFQEVRNKALEVIQATDNSIKDLDDCVY